MTTSRNLARSLALWAVALMAICLCACFSSSDGLFGGTQGAESLADRVSSGLSIQAARGSKTLDIARIPCGGKRPANLAKDSWTVFVYLCGSDLETEGAAATRDLNEMLSVRAGNNVSFVVETGGAKTWRNKTVNAKKLGRYLIRNGSMQDVGSVPAASMGEASTLSDFLTWGVRTYPAEHMALILWDHGGGSITGVCFDERNNNDSLSLRELDQALATTYACMWDKFEFVGFDACLMSTLETANVLASYADYMIASQESEPSTGWEYTSFANHLAKKPASTGAEVGKTLCNAYLNSLDRNTKGFATLAVVDLSKIDQLMQDFYRFSQEMYESGGDQGTLAAMTRGIQSAENYGCNNRREGYTNMVDLGGLVDACAAVTPSAADVQQTLRDAVPYQVRGTFHAAATGLSTYYPLKINTAQELAVFQTVATNPSYLSYIDRVAHGATYNGGSQYQHYSNETFFEDGLWSWLLGNTQELQQETHDTWSYVEDHTDNSTQVTFAAKPQVDDEGTYWFQLDQHGIDNAAVVSGYVYEESQDGSDLILLGETYDVYGNWDTGEFADGFDGNWLSLPDGQNLNLSVQSATDEQIVYTSPILLNDNECYLRIRQDIPSGAAEVEGVWSGIAEDGSVDRGVRQLKKGDKIVPLYSAISAQEYVASSDYEGETYTVGSKGPSVDYGYLPDGKYQYSFCIQDAFGDCFYTDVTHFEIDKDGNIYFV